MQKEAWGKLKKGDGGELTATLGLLEHSIDVAAVALALLNLPTCQRRMQRLAGRALEPLDRDRLSVLAFLHDLGKTCTGFQSKALDGEERLKLLSSASISGSGVECGHTAILGALLHHPERCRRLAAAVPIAEIDDWGGLDLWLAAVSHHGQPLNFRNTQRHPLPQHHQTWSAVSGYDPWANLERMGAAARALFPAAFTEDQPQLPQAPEFVHAFAGLVSLADWIGSDSRPHAFPYDLAQGLERWPAASARAHQVLRAMCIDVEAIRKDLIHRDPAFGEIFTDPEGRPFAPTALQAAVGREDLGPLVVAESETGSGKTEAALWRFKTLFEKGEVDSLAFLLPTRVSAVQIEERVRIFIERLFPDPALRPNVLLALPGYWHVDGVEAKSVLPDFEVLWPDGNDEAILHKRWVAENTKRYLAACCAVGTIDQLLLAGLQTRHSHLRGFVALRSLLVVDEVHASDAYMARILENVLQRHQQAGGHALLLSATLGLATRDRLLNRNDRARHHEQPQKAPYPSITDQGDERGLERSDRSKTVQVHCQDWLDDPACIAEFAVTAARQGARLLVLRNTVNAAIETQQAIEALPGADESILFRGGAGDGVICLHHGRYAAPDRRVLDRAVETSFGKKSPSRGLILVGTQTLEQSLDIDADLLITDLAPIDVLLQRIGRLHRHHTRSRPAGFGKARVVVLTPSKRELLTYLARSRSRHGMGPERAYENLPSLDATWTLLEQNEQLTIPEQNRELVESATDPARLEQLANARGGDWTQAWGDAIGAYIAGRQASGNVLCRWNKPWDDSEFPDDERRIQTRLGIAAARLELLEEWQTPFGEILHELAIPHWMSKESGELETRHQKSESSELFIETNGGVFKYGRFGLSHN